jgi:hypothetical protein
MISVTIEGKSKSPSVPLLQRGRRIMAIGTDHRSVRIAESHGLTRMTRLIPPFAKGGLGGFALSALGDLP